MNRQTLTKNLSGNNNVVISASGLAKSYQMGQVTVEALKNATFSLTEGSFTAIMGPSGSGKSTLLNLLGCLENPTKGELIFNGADMANLNEKTLAHYRAVSIGYIFQAFHLVPVMTVLDNVILQLEFAGFPPKRRKIMAQNALEKVDLSHRIKHYPRELSGGERQRVAIARAIAKEPALLLADEPTGNLDSTNSNQIMTLLSNINKQGTTMIMVTHDPEVGEMAERILKMRDGLLLV